MLFLLQLNPSLFCLKNIHFKMTATILNAFFIANTFSNMNAITFGQAIRIIFLKPFKLSTMSLFSKITGVKSSNRTR